MTRLEWLHKINMIATSVPPRRRGPPPRGAWSALWLLAVVFSLGATHPTWAQSPVWALRGAHNTVYLAESIHLLKPGAATLPPAFEHAWKDSSVLVMELDLARLEPTAIRDWVQQHGRLDGATTLEQVLGREDYAHVLAEAVHLGLPPTQMAGLKPWLVALMFTDIGYERLGYAPNSGVEQQLLARNRGAASPHQTAGLETLDQELGQLDQLPLEDQARFLQQSLADLKDTGQDTDKLLRAWRRGDNAALAKLLSEEYTRFPALYDALVTTRNQLWLPQIRRFLQDDHNYLVVVGALHVVGRGGLLELLKADGVEVKPVK